MCVTYYVIKQNNVYYMTLRSANHIIVRMISGTQCHISHQLVWHIYICTLYNMGKRDLADIYALGLGILYQANNECPHQPM